jgi:fatty-acyl-CoA synthase
VRDAVVVGVPDDRFGEVICAWVVPTGEGVDAEDLIAHAKRRLAGYKAPRHVLATPSIGRSPAGKVDYARLKREAAAELGSPA